MAETQICLRKTLPYYDGRCDCTECASSPTAADLDKDAEIARLRGVLEKIAKAKMLVGWDSGPSVCYAAETAGRAIAVLTQGKD